MSTNYHYSFNTSNVSVERVRLTLVLMVILRFNTSNVSVERKGVETIGLSSEFQYIKCIGWTWSIKVIYLTSKGFNTSNVSVELVHYHYNIFVCSGFNTSNVSVELTTVAIISTKNLVSIHQMYRLNVSNTLLYSKGNKFQYIKCIGWT